MTLLETESILKWVDSALEVYRKNEGKLTVEEIRIKSLLGVVRKEVADQVCAAVDGSMRRGR